MKFRQLAEAAASVAGVCLLIGLVHKHFFAGDQSSGSAGVASEQVAAHESRPEDAQGLQFIASPLLYGAVCEKVDNAVVFDRTYGTATANNHPAYVFGYRFTCVSNFGNETKEIYVGWIDNKNTDKLQCLHHNANKQAVLSDGWYACGGNFRVRE